MSERVTHGLELSALEQKQGKQPPAARTLSPLSLHLSLSRVGFLEFKIGLWFCFALIRLLKSASNASKIPSESDVCVELRRTVSVSVCLGLLGLALALGLIPRACVCIYVSFSEAEN